ncbi:MAG: flagellar basal body P-ring formation chaperone FlgA [Bryobacteraceae bacterium]|jgi:flagella basal body P-ring formation protein FlgA
MKPLLALCLFGLASAWAAAPCAIVDGDRILASDIAPHVPLFAELDPNLVAGYAPAPGSHRTFSGGQLRAIAERSGVASDGILPGVCFERALAMLTPERIQQAMIATLKTSTAKISIVEFSRLPVPSGELEFPRAGLKIPAGPHREDPALWRGTVRYSPQHTVAVWARVRIEEERPVVVALRELRAGVVIAAGDFVILRRTICPLEPHLETASDVVGRSARRTIASGSFISDDLMAIPPDIAPGQTVHVIASRGFTRITFDAVASSGGNKGNSIVLLNPESHIPFRAIVDGRGQAHTDSGDPAL